MLSNIDAELEKLPECDRHLLEPPRTMEAPSLCDLIGLLRFGRSNGQELFHKLLSKYYDIDRSLRVSHIVVDCSLN